MGKWVRIFGFYDRWDVDVGMFKGTDEVEFDINGVEPKDFDGQNVAFSISIPQLRAILKLAERYQNETE